MREHRIGDLGEAALLEYAQARKLDEAVVALSLLCTLPVDVVERAMLASDKEALLILAKALDLSWATTLALLFLGAPDYRIATRDLDAMKAEFAQVGRRRRSGRCCRRIARAGNPQGRA